MSKHLHNKSKSKIIQKDESNDRIITKTLVYIIGLSETIANRELLSKYEYLGQYGVIKKIVINKKQAYNQNSKFGPSYSAYITYSKPSEASIAILSLDNIVVDNHVIRASFGTTKYCSFYLKKMTCNNKDCVFLHKKANKEDIITRDDLTSNKILFYTQQLYAIKLGDIYNESVKKEIMSRKKVKTMFPSPDVIYKSEIVIKNQPVKKAVPKPVPASTKVVSAVKQQNDKINTIVINSINNINAEFDNITATTTTNSNDNMSDGKSALSLSSSLNGEKSRFDFVNNTTEENQEVNVPMFVKRIVNKASHLMIITKFYKRDKYIDDMFVYDDEINSATDEQWKKYLINSRNWRVKDNRVKDDLVEDFEKINNFILNQENE